jgi:putative tricarboxylic transport membrane protein
VVACAVGVLGYALHASEIPLAPVVPGMVLGPLFEINLRRSLLMSDGSWAIFGTGPTAVVLLVVSFALLVIPLAFRSIRRPSTAANASVAGATSANKAMGSPNAADE